MLKSDTDTLESVNSRLVEAELKLELVEKALVSFKDLHACASGQIFAAVNSLPTIIFEIASLRKDEMGATNVKRILSIILDDVTDVVNHEAKNLLISHKLDQELEYSIRRGVEQYIDTLKRGISFYLNGL